MNIRQQLEDIRLLFMNGRLAEAGVALDRLQPTTTAELRMHAHYVALREFYQGRVRIAKGLMLKAADEFGDNFNLLRDQVVCDYHLNDMISFRSGLSRLEVLLAEKEQQLEPVTMLEGELMLGKFYEEDARLQPAVIFYDRALQHAKTPEQRFRVLVQKARWQALYEPGEELSDHYRELISFPHERITRDQQIELQHALMMIELRLVGADHAWARIGRLDADVAAIDQRLLVFDFVEGSLAQDLPLNPTVLKRISEFDDLAPYERFLKMLVQGSLEQQAKIQELDRLATQLSWSSYLRLLCLCANLETGTATRQELNRKIQLIIRGLDPRSQSLWNRRLKQALQTPEVRLELSLRGRQVSVQGRSVDLSKKKIAMQLLEGLLRKESLSVDQAIHLLWQTSFSPEYYHRLRMSTHRLNTLVHEITGLGKIIEVDSQNVRLRPEVKLKCVDDGLETGILGL
ncbi:MAG: hypothetical protein KF799_11535 [Bdellovibrionales bacterium]|nr:hypothetical protein [Bdellovibrionales bacterium]